MRKLRYGGPNEKVTWAAKVLDVGVVLFVTAIFWIPAVLYAMDDYAIQKHPVMATNKALVTEVHNYHRTSDLEVEYTTNTGEHITTELTNGWFSCCDTDPDDPAHQGLNAHPRKPAHVGNSLKIKYVSDDPSSAYPADYQPRYVGTMVFGCAFLLTVSIIFWYMGKEWREQNRNAAANTGKRQASAAAQARAQRQVDARRQAKRQAADQRQADATARHNAKYHGNSK